MPPALANSTNAHTSGTKPRQIVATAPICDGVHDQWTRQPTSNRGTSPETVARHNDEIQSAVYR
jgi:hypothetical protein